MRLAALGVAIAIAGCAAPPPATVAEPKGAAGIFGTGSPAEEAVAYMGGLRAMNDAALAAEARRQRAAVRGDRDGDLTRVKAALALSLVEASEESEILALVEPVAKRDPGEPSLKALAGFLHGIAVDRRRLKESAAAANARLKDERRSHEQLRSTATAAQERAVQLQQKLDALTALEKSLSGREPTR